MQVGEVVKSLIIDSRSCLFYESWSGQNFELSCFYSFGTLNPAVMAIFKSYTELRERLIP